MIAEYKFEILNNDDAGRMAKKNDTKKAAKKPLFKTKKT